MRTVILGGMKQWQHSIIIRSACFKNLCSLPWSKEWTSLRMACCWAEAMRLACTSQSSHKLSTCFLVHAPRVCLHQTHQFHVTLLLLHAVWCARMQQFVWGRLELHSSQHVCFSHTHCDMQQVVTLNMVTRYVQVWSAVCMHIVSQVSIHQC